MAEKEGTRGGSHEQHVKAGEQSHKGGASHVGSEKKEATEHKGTQGGTPEQHAKAGHQSHK